MFFSSPLSLTHTLTHSASPSRTHTHTHSPTLTQRDFLIDNLLVRSLHTNSLSPSVGPVGKTAQRDRTAAVHTPTQNLQAQIRDVLSVPTEQESKIWNFPLILAGETAQRDCAAAVRRPARIVEAGPRRDDYFYVCQRRRFLVLSPHPKWRPTKGFRESP